LGGLKLSDILGMFLDDLGIPSIPNIPNLTTATDESKGTITVSYKLTASLKADPTGTFVPNGAGQFTLMSTAVVSLKGQPPTYNVSGSLTPFTINLVGGNTFIVVPFKTLAFTAKSKSKTHVDVSVGTVTFAGALSFVNSLEQFLHDIGNSGLSIDVTPTEVGASMSLSLPAVEVGVFSLSGISFSSALTIPFLGDPALLTFGFASQDNPFILTVCMFGGGGFLSLGLGFAGVQSVQASFEFAGQFALDIGVASGGVTIAAGVYYSYAVATGTTLTGFLRITGEVEVLGIISISAELDLTLTYVSDNGVSYIQGTATLKVSISICFFSVTIPLTVTKQFAGSGSSAQGAIANGAADTGSGPDDPGLITFKEMVPAVADWKSYCLAFTN
jgi:hypothetical protein